MLNGYSSYEPIRKRHARQMSFYDSRLSQIKLIDLNNGAALPMDEVIPWIDKYTTGEFYLSDFAVGFIDENDLLMFKLAFKR